ncbi:MAG: hypothetical protein BGN85_07985 [Alphaproteobacteria bacterium 64-11]|nr:MAG: hypothetical protein BGN85_07985 [Alphaproteobacteria bacterium 64-11]
MHRLFVLGRQRVGAIDRGMVGGPQHKKLAGAQQQYLTGRSGLVRRRWLGHEMAHHRIKHTQMAQRLADQRAGKAGIAGRQSLQ